jgi:hypothetical protein
MYTTMTWAGRTLARSHVRIQPARTHGARTSKRQIAIRSNGPCPPGKLAQVTWGLMNRSSLPSESQVRSASVASTLGSSARRWMGMVGKGCWMPQLSTALRNTAGQPAPKVQPRGLMSPRQAGGVPWCWIQQPPRSSIACLPLKLCRSHKHQGRSSAVSQPITRGGGLVRLWACPPAMQLWGTNCGAHGVLAAAGQAART